MIGVYDLLVLWQGFYTVNLLLLNRDNSGINWLTVIIQVLIGYPRFSTVRFSPNLIQWLLLFNFCISSYYVLVVLSTIIKRSSCKENSRVSPLVAFMTALLKVRLETSWHI